MQTRAFTQVALSASSPLTHADPCSWSTTTTIEATAATYSAPCPTVTGSIAVAGDVEGTFELHGIEEIQGSLDIIDAEKLASIDLGDLQKVDVLSIVNSRVSWDGLRFPNLHTVKRVDWARIYNFNGSGNGNAKIRHVDDLYVTETNIGDLSDVFDLETVEYAVISGNENMQQVTLPNLRTVDTTLDISRVSLSATISFPALELVGRLSVTGVGNETGLAEETLPSSSLDLPKLAEAGGSRSGSVIIRDNPSLLSVDAPALVRVRGDVRIENNPRMHTMPFKSLKSVNGDLIYTGSFTALSNKVESTFGMVRYESDKNFDCRLHYGSTTTYKGGYYCTSASGAYGTDPIYIASATAPTPQAALLHTGPPKHLKWWEIMIICITVFVIVASIVYYERQRKQLGAAELAGQRKKNNRRVNIPTVNNTATRLIDASSADAGSPPPPVYGPRVYRPWNVDVAADNAMLPPPITAMVPPPKYSEAVGRDAEKTALERGYLDRD